MLAHQIPTAATITLAAPLHGTIAGGQLTKLLPDISPLSYRPLIHSYFGPAGLDQLTDSPFLKNVPPQVAVGTRYTCIATRNDEVVVPVESCFLPGARNLTVQEKFPNKVVLHGMMPTDRSVQQLVIKAIAKATPPLAANPD